jgi:hypothetical protein
MRERVLGKNMRELHLLTLAKISYFSELIEDNLLARSQEASNLVS